MTSFGWKKKAGAKVSKSLTEAFSADAKDVEDSESEEGLDWLRFAPRKSAISLEDANAKSERLKLEGSTLAEAERYWEALKKWEEAVQLAPHNYKILDMKAQALMAVGELFPAVQAAEKTVRVAPTWWEGHQTLGRALAGVGEVRMALKSFSRAVHINPADTELWTEDLNWAWSLLEQHRHTQQQQQLLLQQQQQDLSGCGRSTVTVRELTADGSGDEEEDEAQQLMVFEPRPDCVAGEDEGSRPQRKRVKRLPRNYVQMRDPT